MLAALAAGALALLQLFRRRRPSPGASAGRSEGPRRELVEIAALLRGLTDRHDGGQLLGDPAALRLAFEELARGAKELRAYNFGDTVELHARPESAPPPLAKAVAEAHGGSLRAKNGALVLTLPRMPDVEDRRVY